MRQNFSCLTLSVLVSFLLICPTGCSMLPESMQPHQLQKLNRGDGYSDDPFFSIQDSEATARQRALKNALTPDLDDAINSEELSSEDSESSSTELPAE